VLAVIFVSSFSQGIFPIGFFEAHEDEAVGNENGTLNEHTVRCEKLKLLILAHSRELVLQGKLFIFQTACIEKSFQRQTASFIPRFKLGFIGVIELNITKFKGNAFAFKPLLRLCTGGAFRITNKYHIVTPCIIVCEKYSPKRDLRQQNSAADEFRNASMWMKDKGLTSEAEIREAVRSSHSFGTWMVDQFDRILAKMGNTQAEERTVIRKARRLYTDALREIKNTATNGGVRNSISDITEDGDGNTLSKGQQEYFKDSKVRDESGNLLKMYRGDSNTEINIFDRKKSKYSNLYGRGFYFTTDENQAGYYGDAKPYYLDIKNPVSLNETSITRSQMRKFLEAIAYDDDYGLENYGYGATVTSILNSIYGKSDFDMLQDISATAIGDLVKATEIFNEVNGTKFDGFILPTETVVFNSNQIKNIDNLSPTGNEDIRYSYSAEDDKKSLDEDNKKRYNKKRNYPNQGRSNLLAFEHSNEKPGTVRQFFIFGKAKFFEKTFDGIIELSREQFNEKRGYYAEDTYGRAQRKIGDVVNNYENSERGVLDYTDSYRNKRNAEILSRQALGEELRDESGRGLRSSRADDDGIRGVKNSYSSFYDNAESNTEAKDSQTALDDYLDNNVECQIKSGYNIHIIQKKRGL